MFQQGTKNTDFPNFAERSTVLRGRGPLKNTQDKVALMDLGYILDRSSSFKKGLLTFLKNGLFELCNSVFKRHEKNKNRPAFMLQSGNSPLA